MNMPELKTPIRIYWDLPAVAGDTDLLSVGEQIIALKILSLDLTAAKAAPTVIYLPLLELFSTVQMALSLTIPLATITPALLDKICPYRLRNLLMAIEGSAELARVNTDVFKTAGGAAPGISFTVAADNYHQLPEIYAFCASHDFSLVLPMQRLSCGGGYFTLNRQQLQKLSGGIKEVVKPDKMQVTIHDPFLWRVFFPALGFPEGSCQAANTMLSITANGDVYPCPSLPVDLGNIKEMTLSSIVHSMAKRSLRENLMKTPGACDGCIELSGCFGGCRGRGYVAGGSWDEPDPGCR